MAETELHRRHSRSYAGYRFVYPVLSRRAGGISVGINLNPDKICNFDCIYCQVDRTHQGETRFVDTATLSRELDDMLAVVTSGELFETEPFCATPTGLRRLNDIAFSGDGEPTTYTNFDQLIDQCAQIKRKHGLREVKMVLITNASMLHRPHVRRGLDILDENQGEIWAKLEAGTDEYYRLVERTPIPFRQVLDNIKAVAQQQPIVIQSLFMRIHGEPPSDAELVAYCDRLAEIASDGGQLRLVQVYTVARQPAEGFVAPLHDDEVDAIVNLVRTKTALPTKGFYGMYPGSR